MKSLKPKNHKNFYITLDTPPDNMYTDGDVVSGKCVLLSSRDEDLAEITLSFNGNIKTHIQDHDYRESSQVHTEHFKSEYVLFQEKKVIYQGSYTLRRNIPYEWPFRLQLPSSLPPNCSVGSSGYGTGEVIYELTAARTRTWQDPEMIERQIDPLNHLAGAPFQPSSLFKKLGSFAGMVASVTLPFMPPRPKRASPCMTVWKVDCQFPMVTHGQTSGSHNKVSGIFHSHSSKEQINGTVLLELPRNIIHGVRLPAFLKVAYPQALELPSIHLQAIDIHLKVHTKLFDRSARHHKTLDTKHFILNESKTKIPLSPNNWLDLNTIFNLQLDPNILPNFTSPLIEISYDLVAHMTFEVAGKKHKADFLVESVQVMSNKTIGSPLFGNYLCTFIPEIRRTSSEPSPMIYPGREQEADVDMENAFLALSRVLSQKSIPHNPVQGQNGLQTLYLHGRAPLPSTSSSFATTPPSEPGSVVDQIEDPWTSDRKLLDEVVNTHTGFGIVNNSQNGTTNSPSKVIAIWHRKSSPSSYGVGTQGESKVYIRIEISDPSQPQYHDSKQSPPGPQDPLSMLLKPFNDSLRRAANHSSPSQQLPCISDLLYMMDEFGPALRMRLNQIDSNAAYHAAGKFPELREPLMRLGINVDGPVGGQSDEGTDERLREDFDKLNV